MDTDPDALRAKWDARYARKQDPGAPARVLTDFAHLLPADGVALDLACGLGANGLFLAESGLTVQAWDISPMVVERLSSLASERGVPLTAKVRDVSIKPPDPASFDVIVVSHFLDRALCEAIMHALRPSGLLFFQTFARDAVTDRGPSNPAYRLADNELLRLFSGLSVRAYREDGRVGRLTQGWRDLAYLVAQKSRSK